MKRLLLIDGHSIIYRSFFAFIRQPLRNSKGANTSAVFGFANTLRKLLDGLKPDLAAVVFDAPGRTFRDEKFAEYKAQRPSAPEELPGQVPVVKEMVRAWGLPSFEVPGVEADDVIATFAASGNRSGLEVIIATTDKDLLQLVGGGITAYDPWQEKRYGPKDVKEKLGVGPELVRDYLALVGDASDNIPGVPGVGPKRALDILTKHGSFEAALKQDERVKKHTEMARLSRELVEVRTDVPLPAEPGELEPKEPDRMALARVFEEMEFHGLLREMGMERAASVKVTGFTGMAAIERKGRFAFSVDAGRVWVSVDGASAMDATEQNAELLSDPHLLKVGHAVKAGLKGLRDRGLKLVPPVFDVGIGAWLVDPNRKRYDLEDVALSALGENVVFEGAAARAGCTLRAYEALATELQARGLDRLATEMEMPLIFVLEAMEQRGVKVDTKMLDRLRGELALEQQKAEQEIWRLAGFEFNVGSPKQLGDVLFERLKLPKGKKTKTGFSTSSDVLEGLADKHEIAAQVLRYRELDKLSGTYLGPLSELADPRTHRIHATFNQTGTSTGRLSASDPNLQNIPIRTELGRKLRDAFVADKGKLLVSADYSQIELRVLAHFSGDERLCRAFEKGEDVHVATAAAILEVKPESVTEEQRRIAKMVNYGLLYGMGGYGLSTRMDIPVERAQQFLDEYMERFSGVAKWRDATIEAAKQAGVVRTITGRIRPVPGITDSNRMVAEAAKRAALNAPLQGSAADIIKQAMLTIESKLPDIMILQIHDELLFEVEAVRADQVAAAVKAEMEAAWKLNVPLEAEVGKGKSWGEAH